MTLFGLGLFPIKNTQRKHVDYNLEKLSLKELVQVECIHFKPFILFLYRWNWLSSTATYLLWLFSCEAQLVFRNPMKSDYKQSPRRFAKTCVTSQESEEASACLLSTISNISTLHCTVTFISCFICPLLLLDDVSCETFWIALLLKGTYK